MRAFRRFARDRRGGASILAAISLFALVGAGALAVDVSHFFYQKRRLQAAADLAAIAAASDPTRATAAARASLASNGFDPSVLETVETGAYAADPAVSAASRFTPGAGSAVRVTLKLSSPLFLGKALSLLVPTRPAQAAGSSTTGATSSAGGGASTPPAGLQIAGGYVLIRARGAAAQANFASFAIGSRLLQLDGGVLNGVLGGLFGTTLSLSLMDYQSLASVQVDAFAFSNALATRVNLTGVTYGSVAQGSYRLPDVLNAAADAARASNAGAATVLSRLATQMPGSASSISLAPILNFGPYASRTVGAAGPIAMSMTALDLVSAAAQVAGKNHQVSATLAVSLPGIASASVQLAVGERPVGTTMAAAGAPGASAHTAQTRLLLTVGVVGAYPASLVTLPLYIELASGTATLSDVSCTGSDATTARVTLGVTPAVVDAWIGAVSNSDFVNMTTAPAPGSATLLNFLGLATVTGRAHATMSNMTATPVVYSWTDIAAATKKTTSTTDFTASLLASLLGDLRLNANVLGLGIGVPSNLTGAVATTLSGATGSIDTLVNSLLVSLGVGLGQADTWVTGVKCGQAVLVN